MGGGVRGYINESYNHIKIIEDIFTISEVIFTISVRATLRLIRLFWQHLERGFLFTINSGMRMVGTECIHSILFILPLGAEWMEWRSVNSGI